MSNGGIQRALATHYIDPENSQWPEHTQSTQPLVPRNTAIGPSTLHHSGLISQPFCSPTIGLLVFSGKCTSESSPSTHLSLGANGRADGADQGEIARGEGWSSRPHRSSARRVPLQRALITAAS